MNNSKKIEAVNEFKNAKNEDSSPRYMEDVDFQTLNQKVQTGHTFSVKKNYKNKITTLVTHLKNKKLHI